MVKKRKAKVGTVPVYLRDLSDSLQREFLGRNWDNKRFHKANAKGKDIVVGYYLRDKDWEVRE